MVAGPAFSYHSMRHDVRIDAPGTDSGRGAAFWGDDGLTFGDFLDLINPLQHIPVVGSIYRAVTGDGIAPGARIFGGALYGGPIGLVGAAINAMIEETTGHDVGGLALALLDGDDPGAATGGSPPPTAIAEAAPPPGASDGPPPIWLARMPQTREDYAVLAARYGSPATAGNILEAMGKALDKYESMGGALPLPAQAAPPAEEARIDTVL
ncbi:MAG: hypothetical protein ACE5H8_09315 [Alphaproteobacteria bacterium]